VIAIAHGGGGESGRMVDSAIMWTMPRVFSVSAERVKSIMKTSRELSAVSYQLSAKMVRKRRTGESENRQVKTLSPILCVSVSPVPFV